MKLTISLPALKRFSRQIWRQRLGVAFALALLLLCQTQGAWGQGPKEPRAALPTIYEFARPFCPICKEMQEVLGEVRANYAGQFEVRPVYISEEAHLFQGYHVSLVPTQVFLDARRRGVLALSGETFE